MVATVFVNPHIVKYLFFLQGKSISLLVSGTVNLNTLHIQSLTLHTRFYDTSLMEERNIDRPLNEQRKA